VFPSHFYTALVGEEQNVSACTSNINIFEKRVVFIPICQANHWTLCVIVNPGAVIEARAYPKGPKFSDRISCMILMNSLKSGDDSESIKVQATVLKWLNREWDRIRRREDITSSWKATIGHWECWKAEKEWWTTNAFGVDTIPIINPNGNVQVNV
jgi:Ulp1 protease family, C-terminal catalytic domain